MEHADSDTNIKQSKSNHLGKLALICSPWNRTIGFVQIRHFPYIIRKTLLEPWKTKRHASSDSNSISSFQALCTAVASCVGSGNIVGVSTAVLAGGLGAIFWMWVAAFVGMATKYGEIILGLLYRVKNEDGTYSGGPMYYIRDGLHAPVLASLCAFSW